MTLRKLDDNGWLKARDLCRSPEHNPPNMIVLENGLWEHTCPECGHKTTFRVERPTF